MSTMATSTAPVRPGRGDVVLDNIPPAIRTRPQWVCWRYVEREGKVTKCPFDAKDGTMADSTAPSTWSTYEEAVAACQRDSRYEGIGFVFAADDPFCGVDLDDCIDETGEMKPWGRRLVELLNSYSEISPSGTGVKVFLQATKPGDRCRKAYQDGEVEMYDQERYFTVTGQRLGDGTTEIEARQLELEQVYWEVFEPPALPSSPRPDAVLTMSVPASMPLSDEQILEKARRSKTGPKFSTLWDGQWDGLFRSASEADSSLVFMLAFYTKDAEQIDRMFRHSGLMRSKWDEKHGARTYGQMTIDKALAKVTAQYEPGRRLPPASNSRPNILIDTDEHRVVCETISALRADPDIYQRGGMLVRILRDKQPQDGVQRCCGSATISMLPQASLRERMTQYATFTKQTRRGDEAVEVAAHPTLWLVAAVDARGDWPDIRHLAGISDVPILRPDGSLCQTPGYDHGGAGTIKPRHGWPLVRQPEEPDRLGSLRQSQWTFSLNDPSRRPVSPPE